MRGAEDLREALRGLVRREMQGEVRVASVTVAQRRGAQGAWARAGRLPAQAVIALTTNEGGTTRAYFMVGKDTLGDGETWVLG